MTKAQFQRPQDLLKPEWSLVDLPLYSDVSELTVESQLTMKKNREQNEDRKNLLVISPYTELPHLLDLDSLDSQPALLARALTSMKSIRPDYATSKYVETFNWEEVIANLRQLIKANKHTWKEQRFFAVVFRSTVQPTTDYGNLGDLDQAAHAEAVASGGFLKYWFGCPNSLGQNLATCLWRNPEDARKGGVGPAHRRAAGAARSSYTVWHIERLGLTIKDAAEEWEITDWASGA